MSASGPWRPVAGAALRAGLGLIVGLSLAGCASTPTAPDPGAGPSVAEARAHKQRGLQMWAERDAPGQLAAALESFEQALLGLPDDAELLTWLAQGSFQLGMDAAPDEDLQLRHWERGWQWGERGLLTFPAYAARVEAGDGPDAALEDLGVEAVPLMYWTALDLTQYATTKGLLTVVGQMGRWRALMGRVAELDPSFHHGGPARFFGIDRAEAPALAGGSLEGSEASFRAAIDMAPDFHLNRVLFAEHLLIPEGRSQEALLQLLQVVEAEPGRIPDMAVPQRDARRRARELLAELGVEPDAG